MADQETVVPKNVADMTDREIAEETLTWLRTAGEAMHAIQTGGMGGLMGQMFRSVGSGRKG